MTIIFRNPIQDGMKFYYLSKIPSGDILESLCKLRIHESGQLKTEKELYDMEIHQKRSMPNYQKWKTVLQRSTDQKLRLQNFDARHGRIETGAVLENRKGMSGDKCLFRIVRLMNNRTKSRRKATIPTKEETINDKNAVAIVKIVPQFGCVSQDSEALVSQRGKQTR